MVNPHRTIETVGVIGAGAWGTALARHVAEKATQVRLWAYEPEVVAAIQSTHENSIFLPGVTLPPSLIVTGSLPHVVQGATCMIFAVPSHVARPVLKQLAP
ncbi:MAG: NAD(P)-binding domain-containing protein, partial [Nitrospiraceae bacterium]